MLAKYAKLGAFSYCRLYTEKDLLLCQTRLSTEKLWEQPEILRLTKSQHFFSLVCLAIHPYRQAILRYWQ